MSTGEIVSITLAIMALLAAVWGHGRVSSYDGWIRRVERQASDGDAILGRRVEQVENAVADLARTITTQLQGIEDRIVAAVDAAEVRFRRATFEEMGRFMEKKASEKAVDDAAQARELMLRAKSEDKE